MDNQPTPPNSAGSAERPTGPGAEQFLAGAPEHAPASESAPSDSATPPPQDPPAAAAPPPTLSVDDVAAAIAAVPGPGGPSGVIPTPTAADVDVIETEWVDRAEEVVQAHQGDPYGEEEAIEDLQQEYLKKRYGYEVADPNSDNSKPEGT